MTAEEYIKIAHKQITESIPVMDHATKVLDSLMKLAQDQEKLLEDMAAQLVKVIYEREEWKGRAEYAEAKLRGTGKVN